MAIDIRATVTCSLGTLISGSISDDYLQGSGLVKTKGSCEISALITPAVGTVVTFDYVKGGVTRAIPRKLRVLSSFADPFRRTTKVELGCKLSYLSDLKEPIKWDAFDDPENASYTEEDDKIITIPIYAGSVMVECLSKLGITASSIPLTNAFSISQFDFSGGYVQVLSDLLVSESYFGYLDFNEVLQVRNLAVQGGTGPVFTSADIVDLGPIGVGQLPGEAVTVSYSTLKLKEPSDDEDDTEKLNWEEDETIGLPTTIRVDNPFFNNNPFPFPVPQYFTYNYIPRSKTITKYDDLDRVTTRTTTEYTILAAIAPGYVQHIAGSAPIAGPSSGSLAFTIVSTERITYAVSALDADPKNPPENYEEVTEQTVTIEEPVLKLNASTTLYDVAGNLNVAINYGLDDAVKFIAEKSSTKYEYGTNVNGAQVAKVLTRKYLCRAYTQEGQQELATYFQSLDSEPDELENDVIPTLIEAEKLKDLGTEIQISIGREIGLQQRPGSAELTNAKYADGGDPNNGWRVDSDSELELALGSATAQRRIEFSLPYAPDDRFAKVTVGGEVSYLTFPSDAPAKANRYGRVQNRLLLGNRSGVNLQVAPEKLPAAPFEPLYLQADGLTALYRANGNQWAFDSNGIVCSTDALFWAAVSGTGTFWFPVAPGVTTLPAEPAIVDGEMNATTIVLPYNETAVYESRLRVGMVVSKFDYALEVLTEVPALTLKVGAGVDRYQLVSVPATDIALAAAAPVVTSSTAVRIPAAIDIAVAAPVPTVGSGIGSFVSVPAAAAITIAAVAPTTTTNEVDGDAAAYIAAVESADGQSLEEGVKSAINSFVLGCKADGIWAAIKASCILAGARTLTGALVPLVGTAPTNVGGLFVSGDYDRETGLVGDGSTKYLDSNRNHNADPQDNAHVTVYASTVGTGLFYGGAVGSASGTSSLSTTAVRCRSSSINTITVATGLLGTSRSASANFVFRSGQTSETLSRTSETPVNQNVFIHQNGAAYGTHRLAFYSIGESLDLALLDTRVTALIDAIAAAIP